MEKDDQKSLTHRMNALVQEMAGLKPNDRRRAEITKELSRLSLESASGNEQNTDG